MTFTDSVYNDAHSHGFTGALADVTAQFENLMVSDSGCVTVMLAMFTYLSGNGYTKTVQQFENGYWTGFGSRPADR